jgi:hypothetical protein
MNIGIFKMTVGMAIGAACLGTAPAQPLLIYVSMSGTIIEGTSGSPIAKASISLAGKSAAKAISDTAGGFILGYTTTGLSGGARRGIFSGADGTAMGLDGGNLHITVQGAPSPVSFAVYGLDSRLRKTLLDARLPAGDYLFQDPLAGMPAGAYVLRGAVGAQTASFKVASPAFGGASAQPAIRARSAIALPKRTEALDDTIVVFKPGYGIGLLPISDTNGKKVVKLYSKLPSAAEIKIYSDRSIPALAWDKNVRVEAWDGDGIPARGTQLNGTYPGGSEGPYSWNVTFVQAQSHSAWAFLTSVHPEDLSDWADGSINLSVKGNVPSLGIMVSSLNSKEVRVDAAGYGYKPDNLWHVVSVPLSEFHGTDFRQVTTYCALFYPAKDGDPTPFNPALSYQIDDVYYSFIKQ